MGIKDDFAREGRPEQVRRLNQLVESELAEWAKRWKLDGACVICQRCGGKQNISDSGVPFQNHQNNSCASIPTPYQLPLGDLAKILSGWHLDLWFDEAGKP
ncbi:MAG: hypothetical protein IV106_21985 [Pseudomonas umsongensis]|nr:hypothetical protein [Pseudomonas umsongensis]